MFKKIKELFVSSNLDEDQYYELSKLVNKSIPILSVDEVLEYKNINFRKLLKFINRKIFKIYGETTIGLLFNNKGILEIGVFNSCGKAIGYFNLKEFANG